MKRLLTSLVARSVRRAALRAADLPNLRPARILVVRQHNQMGDMVCATPVFRALRETWPEAEIALVTAPANGQVVRYNPHLDRILTFDRRMWRRPVRLIAFLREIRGFGADLAFVLASVSFSVTSAGIALASGARHVVGADSRPFGLDLSRYAFSLEMPSQPTVDRHAVRHGLLPLQAVGVTTQDLSTVVVSAPAEEKEAERILAALNLKPGFWALHPGAGKVQNVWPAAGFAEMIRRAVAAGHRVMILHGPADAGALAALRTELADLPEEQVCAAPACSVGVGAALLARAERFLCNDTGIMHVAGALGVPTVALFGPTDPGFWKPDTPCVVALRSPRRDPDDRGLEYGWMENIEPGAVWEAWHTLPVC